MPLMSNGTMQTPPLERSPMVHRPFNGRPGGSFARPWATTLAVRRIVFFLPILLSAGFGASMMNVILSTSQWTPLKWAITVIYTVLFAWIAMNFWSVTLGFVSLLHGHDRWKIRPPKNRGPIPPGVRTAIVMPIYNEDVARIFSSLQTMYASVARTGQLEQFDFFVLSDTNDVQEQAKEEAAWQELCRSTEGHGRIFYRHRRVRVHKKSGNIADFCRRWGSRYKYMLVLDADSVMSGSLMTDMVRTMEGREDIGILQTAPTGIHQENLVGRIQQFSTYAYGPLLLEGLQFWQMDEAGFWGHNALVRLKPFMEHCALPHLSGTPPLGGEILSHDFVEAAMMRRAGWGVWLATDFKDSYEELPPDLFTELDRDRRWSRGNFQHLRLILEKGFKFGHRQLFLNGNLFYFSAFLWFVSFVLMTVYAVVDIFHEPQYFSTAHGLFPDWPVQYRHLSMDLLVLTAVFLFAPKVLSVVWLLMSGQAARFGGAARLIISVLLETVCSFFLAPIRMVFHSWYVMTVPLEEKFDWKKQRRRTKQTTYGKAFKVFGLVSGGALVLSLAAFVLDRTLCAWLLVITVPLILAVPLSVFLSSLQAGQWCKKMGLFLAPVETSPPKL